MIEDYTNEIAKMKPLIESSFKYKTNTWINLDEQWKTLIQEYENKDINRQDVIIEYQKSIKEKKNILKDLNLMTHQVKSMRTKLY